MPQEYRRAAHVLRGAAGARALFLHGYARYLAGERRREEERVEAAGPLGKVEAVNAVRTLAPCTACTRRQGWGPCMCRDDDDASACFWPWSRLAESMHMPKAHRGMPLTRCAKQRSKLSMRTCCSCHVRQHKA